MHPVQKFAFYVWWICCPFLPTYCLSQQPFRHALPIPLELFAEPHRAGVVRCTAGQTFSGKSDWDQKGIQKGIRLLSGRVKWDGPKNFPYIEASKQPETASLEKLRGTSLIYRMGNRIIYRMKVTALLPDELIAEVKSISNGKNITDALVIALKDWVASKKLQQLNRNLKREPLQFEKGFTAQKIRALSRKK